jgi:hypothetical protein
MKKQLRNIIISLCVVVLLVAGVVIWTKVVSPTVKSSSSSDSSASSSSPTIQVYKTDAKDITTLKVKNSTGGYTITHSGDTYSINGIETSLLSQDTLTTTVQAVTDIQATKLVEKGSTNLKQYGLDNPQTVIDITSGGKTTTIDIGNDTPTSDGNYFNVKGSADVYKAATTFISSFSGTNLDFVNMTLVAVDSASLANITDLEFGGAARTPSIVLKQNVSSASSASSDTAAAPTYSMLSPRSYTVDSNNVSSTLTSLGALSASGAITVDMSDKSLQKYGLKNPQYTVTATISGKKVKLDFGTPFNANDTSYLPVVLEGKPLIYKVDASSVPFYNYKLTDLCSTLLFTDQIDTVKSVTVSKGSESYTINFTGTEDKLVATYNGKTLDTNYARKFYESVVGISTEGTAAKPAKGSTYAKIVVNYRDTSKSPTTMEFITIDARKCFWSINGQGDFYILRDSIDNAITTTKAFVGGAKASD